MNVDRHALKALAGGSESVGTRFNLLNVIGPLGVENVTLISVDRVTGGEIFV